MCHIFDYRLMPGPHAGMDWSPKKHYLTHQVGIKEQQPTGDVLSCGMEGRKPTKLRRCTGVRSTLAGTLAFHQADIFLLSHSKIIDNKLGVSRGSWVNQKEN